MALFEELASLEPERLETVAARWLAREEMGRRWSLGGLLARLAELQQFAQMAAASGKPVHLWESM